MLSRGKWNFPNEYGKSLIINAEKEREREREREKERERGTVFGSIPEEGEFVEAETALGTRYGKKPLPALPENLSLGMKFPFLFCSLSHPRSNITFYPRLCINISGDEYEFIKVSKL